MHILFHRHTPWQSAVRCSTNIFASLFIQAGDQVTYMQGMVNLAHVLTGRGRAEYWRKGSRGEHGAWVFTPLSVVPYSRYWPFDSPLAVKLAYATCLPSIQSQVLASGYGEPDVIWTAVPGSSALRKAFPRAKIVFQIVDYYPAFSGSSIKRIERRDYHEADHILVIGNALRHYIVEDHDIDPDKITVLGQGVFTEKYQPDLPLPADIADLPSPIGIWVGVASKGDPTMFAATATKLQALGGSLVIIGPTASWVHELGEAFDNVHLLGSRNPEEIPAYLCHADIGLMLYDQKRQDVYKGQNPLKLYEYAAAGLPILSTDHDEYAYLDAPVIIVSAVSEVGNAMQRAIDERDSLRERGLAFVVDRSWHRVYRDARDKVDEIVLDL